MRGGPTKKKVLKRGGQGKKCLYRGGVQKKRLVLFTAKMYLNRDKNRCKVKKFRTLRARILTHNNLVGSFYFPPAPPISITYIATPLEPKTFEDEEDADKEEEEDIHVPQRSRVSGRIIKKKTYTDFV